MRTALLALVLSLPATSLIAGEAARPTFINARVSAKEICLNETVRVEFTTLPRDIEGVDVAQSVANSLRLSATTTWRLVGEPTATEVLRGAPSPAAPAEGDKPARERPKPITVVFHVLPRTTGDVSLPDIPITWLQGNTVARFAPVVVKPNLIIAGKISELPREAAGVGGFHWSSTLDEVRTRVDESKVKRDGQRTLITPQPNLTLIFTGGIFGEALLRAPGLSKEQARTSFLQRWGIPQQEDANSLTWIIGWIRITARPDADGISLQLVREDAQAQLANAQVTGDVFNVLDGPLETPTQAAERKEREIKAEVDRPAVPEK
ncbi:MAG: hypothetical protein H0W78_10350 [Planctomycetes bacterium]|nr:hypothetical protein [Planctomycetota bacterium]